MTLAPKNQNRRICVVGAGAAGICVARRILEQWPAGVEVRVFEQGTEPGGTWVYSERNEPDTHSAMYAELRTNIPKELMGFSDFPFAPDDFPTGQDPDESFPRHEVVLAYLQRFAEPIRHSIKFNSKISSIEPIDGQNNGEKVLWKVGYESTNGSGTVISEEFDAVFVCTGHYWAPRLPEFAHKLRNTRWMHSRSYRHPQHFAGMRVALIGARLSGSEIALELIEHAEQVYLINSSPNAAISKDIPSNFVELNGTRLADVAENDNLVLADGRVLDQPLDFVIFCTGYHYQFPFMEHSIGNSPIINCDGNFVSPLAAHVAHPLYLDSLFFIGLNSMVAPFPCFDVQTHFALALFDHRIPKDKLQQFSLESTREWERQRIRQLQERNAPLKLFHHLGPLQWEYYDGLNALSGFKGFPKVIGEMYAYNVEQRINDPRRYRSIRYRIVDEQKFEVEERNSTKN